MPRSLWRGSLSFGLVNVPVALFTAVKDMDVHFNQLDEKTGARSRIQRSARRRTRRSPTRRSPAATRATTASVMLTDEELAAAAPEKTRTIEIRSS